ncbi:hypothetical protein [Leptolyngbya ohadii]|uniref:hypothetical protein n=1 Tax=Leptolyngbya ohadii TaxID=1962290 RepID=UPI000B598816|nr:hypothetical protein [Leptolyngbya ohadii]
MKRAILVLGAQRSGTSVTSHVLSELGVQFGDRDRFIKFDHNPIFFELKWVNDLNNRMVKAIGQQQYIDFFLPLEADFLTPEVLPQIQAIELEIDRKIEQEFEQEFGQKLEQEFEQEWRDRNINPTSVQELIIGIKDPRISLTFPVWERVLLARGYSIQIIHAFRSPAGFLRSNQKLFFQWEGWTIDRHLHFWLQLNLSSIYFTRRYPVHLLNYDLLMQFPFKEISQLVSALSLNSFLANQAAAVVKTDHHHHGDSLESLETSISWVNEIYLKLCDRTVSHNDYLNYRQEMLSVLAV